MASLWFSLFEQIFKLKTIVEANNFLFYIIIKKYTYTCEVLKFMFDLDCNKTEILHEYLGFGFNAYEKETRNPN